MVRNRYDYEFKGFQNIIDFFYKIFKSIWKWLISAESDTKGNYNLHSPKSINQQPENQSINKIIDTKTLYENDLIELKSGVDRWQKLTPPTIHQRLPIFYELQFKNAGLNQKKIEGLDFTAIDVETANNDSCSICSIALVTVKNGIITQTLHTHIKPVPSDFIFTYLHGISFADCINSPYFFEFFLKYNDLFYEDLLVAHNASFDFGCIKSAVKLVIKDFNRDEKYGLDDMEYGCSLQLARRVWQSSPNHKLNTLAEHLQIPLNHHDALSDVLACAQIVIKAAEIQQCTDLKKLLNYSSRNNYIADNELNDSKGYDFERLFLDKRISNRLNGFKFIILGTFEVSNQQIEELIIRGGGENRKLLTKHINFILLGENADNKKVSKAKELNIAFINY